MSYRWELLVWLWLVFFLNQADRQVFNVLLPALRQDLGLADIQLGLLNSVFVAVNGFVVPIAGFPGDRIARRRLVLVSLFAWSFSTFCTGFGSGLRYFLLVRSIATAGGEAFYFPAALSMLASEHVESRARALSAFQTSVYAGLIASGWLGGALAQQFGWRAVFWIFGGAGVLLAAVLRYRIRERSHHIRQCRLSYLDARIPVRWFRHATLESGLQQHVFPPSACVRRRNYRGSDFRSSCSRPTKDPRGNPGVRAPRRSAIYLCVGPGSNGIDCLPCSCGIWIFQRRLRIQSLPCVLQRDFTALSLDGIGSFDCVFIPARFRRSRSGWRDQADGQPVGRFENAGSALRRGSVGGSLGSRKVVQTI